MQAKSIFRAGLGMLALSGMAALTGCASIVNGTTQIVTVTTGMGNQQVNGARCQLTNDKGVFYVVTPGTVPVHRAYGDLAVMCEKEAMPTGMATVKSSTKGMAAGNILFGGVIGAAVDVGSGAAYDYPDALHIMMGQTLALGGATLSAPATAVPQQAARTADATVVAAAPATSTSTK